MKYDIANGKFHQSLTFLYKNMKFCIVVVRNRTNDISYNAQLNRFKSCFFGGKIV